MGEKERIKKKQDAEVIELIAKANGENYKNLLKSFKKNNNKNYTPWKFASENFTLSEEFMNKNHNVLDWKLISKNQNFDFDFFMSNIQNIDLEQLKMNIKIPQEVIDSFFKRKEEFDNEENNRRAKEKIEQLKLYIEWENKREASEKINKQNKDSKEKIVKKDEGKTR